MSDTPIRESGGSAPSPRLGPIGEASRPETHRPVPAGAPGPVLPVGSPGTAYGYGSNVLGDTEVHVLDYVRMLYKRRWTALTVFLVVVLTVSVYTFTATPIYQAKIELLIEKEESNVILLRDAVEQNQYADDYYQTQYKILQSRALARKTIDALNLWNHSRYNPVPEASGIRAAVSGPIDAAARWFRRERSTEPPLPEETRAQSATIDRFLDDLSITPIRNSRLVDVKFNSTEPQLAAKVANALGAAFIEQNLNFKFLASKETSDFLGGRLAEQRKQVEASEQAVQLYKEKTDAVALEDKQNIVVQKLTELNGAVTRAKTERIQKEAAYNQIRSLQNDRAALDTFPAILSNTFIQQQKSELANLQRQQAQISDKLGKNHPEMVKLGLAIQTAEAKVQGEISKVVQSMRNDYEQSLAQEQSLTKALDQQKADALALNRKGIEYNVLARDAASNRQIFDSLLQRTKETGFSTERKASNIRVVDPAEVPRRPASPNAMLNLFLALVGGSVGAVGVAFFFEYLDNRIKSPDELKTDLNLTYLGMVPKLSEHKGESPLIGDPDVARNFSESFRALRTNLLFASADEGGRSLVITSTGPSEGKTVVSCNLASALAQAGQRVLLIDADMRKPRVHRVFGAKQDPGLSNVLVGDSKTSASVHATPQTGLWVMPAGTHPPNPAELLGSPRFKDLLASLTRTFDWVLIDTPPVMAATDSCVVAHLANGVMFVVGAEMTSRHAAKRALEQLEHARGRLIGGVLNRVDLKSNPYYYSQYYKKEYADYYETAAS